MALAAAPAARKCGPPRQGTARRRACGRTARVGAASPGGAVATGGRAASTTRGLRAASPGQGGVTPPAARARPTGARPPPWRRGPARARLPVALYGARARPTLGSGGLRPGRAWPEVALPAEAVGAAPWAAPGRSAGAAPAAPRGAAATAPTPAALERGPLRGRGGVGPAQRLGCADAGAGAWRGCAGPGGVPSRQRMALTGCVERGSNGVRSHGSGQSRPRRGVPSAARPCRPRCGQDIPGGSSTAQPHGRVRRAAHRLRG